MPKNYFDERIARRYRERSPEIFEPSVVDPAVDFLAALAPNGSAVEFGIGTGRLALPLSERGVRVGGIDLSDAMLDELKRQPGSERISFTLGDFATTRVGAEFDLVYLVRNTIMNLTTQDEQVSCFENAAAHLKPNGSFVIEVIVPSLRRLPPGERFYPFKVTPTHIGVDEFDVVNQTSISHHYWLADGRLETFSAPFRYVWPAELDLMARLAGMTLRERWSDWHRAPFTAESTTHISVWEKTSTGR